MSAPQGVFSSLRDLLALLRGLRPLGLKSLGTGSKMLRPRTIHGGRHITIGNNCFIRSQGWLAAIERYGEQRFTPRIVIGDNVYIGNRVCITAVDSVSIGAGSSLSEQVYIGDSQHSYRPDGRPIRDQPLQSRGPVSIGRCCFIGYGACILPGVVLGDHCVVGANAVVTKSFPARSVIAGIPAICISTV